MKYATDIRLNNSQVENALLEWISKETGRTVSTIKINISENAIDSIIAVLGDVLPEIKESWKMLESIYIVAILTYVILGIFAFGVKLEVSTEYGDSMFVIYTIGFIFVII